MFPPHMFIFETSRERKEITVSDRIRMYFKGVSDWVAKTSAFENEHSTGYQCATQYCSVFKNKSWKRAVNKNNNNSPPKKVSTTVIIITLKQSQDDGRYGR